MPYSYLQTPSPADESADAGRSARVAWVIYLAVASAAVIGYAVSPTATAKVIFWPIIGWSSVAAILVGVRMHKPSTPLPWYFLAAGTALFSFGDNLYTLRNTIQQYEAMFPSYVDVVYLAMYPAMILGLAFLVRSRTRSRDLVSIVDAAIITGAIGLLAWVLLIVPHLSGDGMNTLERLFSIAYPLGDIALLAVGVRLAFGGGSRSRSFWLLTGSLTGLVVADSLYGYMNIVGTWHEHNPVDAGWILFYLGFGAAALHPSMKNLTLPSEAKSVLGGGRLLLVGAAALMPLVLLLVEEALGGVNDTTAIGFVGIVLFALVLIRTAGLARTIAENEGEARFRSLVQNASDATVVVDAEGVIIYETPSTARVLGTGALKLDGRPLGDLLHPADREKLRRLVASPEADGADEWRLRGSADTWRYIDVVAADLRGEPSVGGVALTMRDSTERKKLSAEREAAIVAANQASSQKSVFLANMSHEIRTPLNGMMGMLGLLVDTDLNAEQSDYVDTMSSSAESLAGLVNDILDFSRIEAGRLELDRQAFVLRPAVEAVLNASAPVARQKGLALFVDFGDDVPDAVVGDRLRLRQVLSNLVSNATKFTERGHVSVKVKRAGRTIRFEVTDTGIGLAPAGRDRLFEQYVQADDSTTRRYGGSGLGLAISKQIVDLMGGEIGVESEWGRGSTFWFSVALQVAEAGAVATPSSEQGLADTRALVVSAQALLRSSVSAILTREMVETATASDADAAFAMLEDAVGRGAPYDVVITDLNLGGIEQVDFIRRLETTVPRHAPSIIAFTTQARGVPKGAHALGCCWVTKPVREAEFLQALRTLLDTSTLQGCVSAPLANAAATVPASHALRAQPAELADGVETSSRPRILIVEDNVINQKVAAATIRQMGFDVDIAGDGLEALQALKACFYDAVLMDCQMPRMDGYEATTEIRLRETDRHIPIIAITASAMASDRERCLEVGMDDYITKPFDRELLEQILSALIPSASMPRPFATTSNEGP